LRIDENNVGARIYNESRTLVVAQKPIELTSGGFVCDPCQTEIIDHKMRLKGIKTRYDDIPLFEGGIVRGIIESQYETRYPEARSETQRKILRQVRSRMDREIEQRIQPINEKIQMFSKEAADRFDLNIEAQEARTDENWLLTAWGVRSKDALGSSTPAPETLPGAFADVKIHESLLNMLIGKLEFEGKRGKVSEFKELLAERFHQPDLIAGEEANDIEVTFEPNNPVVVRFADGRIEITIAIAALKMNRQTHRHFQVIVRYKSAVDSTGKPVLERDGYISLINVRAQILMRAVFGKIFPVNRPLSLVPKMLECDPQFAYLMTGHCRIEKGWFALALLANEQSADNSGQ
jgi:hypothetical protein